MNLAEKLIIRARNYWLKKDNLLLPNPAQTVLIKKYMKMFESEQFQEDASKISPYQFKRRLIKSARHSVGKMILEINRE